MTSTLEYGTTQPTPPLRRGVINPLAQTPTPPPTMNMNATTLRRKVAGADKDVETLLNDSGVAIDLSLQFAELMGDISNKEMMKDLRCKITQMSETKPDYLNKQGFELVEKNIKLYVSIWQMLIMQTHRGEDDSIGYKHGVINDMPTDMDFNNVDTTGMPDKIEMQTFLDAASKMRMVFVDSGSFDGDDDINSLPLCKIMTIVRKSQEIGLKWDRWLLCFNTFKSTPEMDAMKVKITTKLNSSNEEFKGTLVEFCEMVLQPSTFAWAKRLIETY
jgi:hypothetical protein